MKGMGKAGPLCSRILSVNREVDSVNVTESQSQGC